MTKERDTLVENLTETVEYMNHYGLDHRQVLMGRKDLKRVLDALRTVELLDQAFEGATDDRS